MRRTAGAEGGVEVGAEEVRLVGAGPSPAVGGETITGRRATCEWCR